MSWITCVRRVPVYSRRLARPSSYDAWAAGEGSAIIARLAASRRFTLFGRTRAARKALWTELRRKAETGRLATAIDRCTRQCVLAIGEIAGYPLNLPRALIDGYRLTAVPRVTWTGRAFAWIVRELDAHPDLATISGGPEFRLFFVTELLEQIERALATSAPTLRHPLATGDGWFVIGFEPSASWFLPLQGAERRGHFLVCEAPPEGLKRWPAARLQAAISRVQEAVATLSRAERDDLVREARMTANLLSSPVLPPPRPEAAVRHPVRPSPPGRLESQLVVENRSAGRG